jgi:hypothetical protein
MSDRDSNSDSDNDDNSAAVRALVWDDDDELAVVLVVAQSVFLAAQLAHEPSNRGGSVLGRRVVPRNHSEGSARVFNDYFASPPKYGPAIFRRRFRMPVRLFLAMQRALSAFDPRMRTMVNASGAYGLSSLQKCTLELRILAYATPADAQDE